jgi:IPT/TIG domain
MENGRRLVSRALLAATLSMSVLVLGVPAAQAAAPDITSFNPTSGPIGTSVQINGTGFQDSSVVSAVTFNGTAATFTVNSDVLITATVPVGATDGPIAVTDSEGTDTSATNFDVTPSPAPTITSFNPTSGPVGTVVVITGTGFIGATAVTFGGTAATTFTVDSDTQITATVPAGATTGPIAVTTPGGTATSATNFTVEPVGPTVHDRSVTLGLRRHLVARGRVSSSFDACESNVTVKIQKRRGGGWRTVETDTTTANGSYRERIPDRTGRYRALVPRFSADPDNVCARDTSPGARHRH